MYDQDHARRAVDRRIIEAGLSRARVAREAGVSVTTVKNFLTPGGSWPRPEKLAAIERAIGWKTGSVERIANGDDHPQIGQTEEPLSRSIASGDRPVTVGQPDGAGNVVVVLGEWSRRLTDLEREAYEAEVRAFALRLAVEMEEKSRTRRDEPAQQ